jgi:SAM-dependent methyltransferase
MVTRTLDLGCLFKPRNEVGADEAYGIDFTATPENNVVKADLVVDPIPFQDEYFDWVTAHDFFEHIPRLIYMPHRRQPFVELMSEIHRVLKMGGTVLSVTPAVPQWGPLFTDPTHVNYITDQTFEYFGSNRFAALYGFTGQFQIDQQQWNGMGQLITVMRKVPVDTVRQSML